MNLKQLKDMTNALSDYLSPHHNLEDIDVVIPVDSINRHGEEVTHAVELVDTSFKFDDEQLEIVLFPKMRITPKYYSCEDAIEPIKNRVNRNTVFYCARCRYVVSKNSNFCQHCGQQLKRDISYEIQSDEYNSYVSHKRIESDWQCK